MATSSEAVIAWLLSADHVPCGLAARLQLPAPSAHTLSAWRFRGRWTHSYAGELGHQRSSHTTNIVEEVLPDGELEQRIEGSTATSKMQWREVSGQHTGSFDVVLIEGAAPDPPGPGFAAKAARTTLESEGQPSAATALWPSAGMQRVHDEAGVALRAHLGSPYLDRLKIDTHVELTHTDRAPVVVLEFDARFDGAPLRLIVGPDGATWGTPPRDEARKEELSGGSAKIVLSALAWIVATIIGLFAFVVPGVIAAVLGVLHLRKLVAKRDQQIELWREQERPALSALVAQSLAPR